MMFTRVAVCDQELTDFVMYGSNVPIIAHIVAISWIKTIYICMKHCSCNYWILCRAFYNG